MACRLAAERMTDAEIEELRQVLHTHERDKAFQAGLGYYQQEGDFDFHYRIIQGAGNRTLTQMLCGELYQLVRMYRIQFSATPIVHARPLPSTTAFLTRLPIATVNWPNC